MKIDKRLMQIATKHNKEFWARQYLKNEKFNKMNEAQKEKAVQLLCCPFQFYINTEK